MHFFHAYVLFKIQLGLYEGVAFFPGFELKNYASVYMRLDLYAIIYGIYMYIYIYIYVYIYIYRKISISTIMRPCV